jgi:cobalt/nickel transport system ATP-binding protein
LGSELLELRGVDYAFPGGISLSRRFPSIRSEAIAGTSLSVRAGESIAVLGPNGSGKSTLLRLCDGLVEPDRGEVRWKGEDVHRSRSALARLRTEVGFLFQDPDDQLFAGSLLEDAAFGPLNLGMTHERARDRAREALETVGLSAFEDLPPHLLSQGMRKRAALAGVLALRPRLLLLDELSAGLDPASLETLLEVLSRARTDGVAIVVATHDLEFARECTARAVVLSEGRLVCDGPTEDVLADRTLLSEIGLFRAVAVAP